MRQIFSKISLAAAIILGCQFSAQAAVQNLGLINGTGTLSSPTINGSFLDLYNFTVTPPKTAGFATTSILFPTIYGIVVTSLNVYAGTFTDAQNLPAVPISLPFVTSIATSGDIVMTTLASSAVLQDAGYTLVIGGTSIGTAAYTGIIALTDTPRTLPPVPEPETYAMLLAGLGMLGFIARRRQKNT